ncbi:segregation and condensation protein A [Streptomyces albipurpureus]|uniref:Segregation and condensation protein A n=1 Tax=Streptomyces albipurpureus TaxID=2897419 RepID=A0ABT0UYZ3_9ACTN|nr:ScpA family protein [Streptomyces sp. CWNU-1]MCM2393189.1 segregation/condensation protein A [Streptomyces sp. CWNU-1]
MPPTDPPRPSRRALGPGPVSPPGARQRSAVHPVAPGVQPADAAEPVAGDRAGAEAAAAAEQRPVRGTTLAEAEAEAEAEAGTGTGTGTGVVTGIGAERSERPDTPRAGVALVADGTSEPRGPGTRSEPEPVGDGRFTVRLVNFEGPFDLLLQLISKHKLDVTEVALSRVTDEFMTYIRAMGEDWDLDQTTEFLVVAATLLDLKAARLLPTAEVEDEADLALLEARDLLFARLLQYRAYKQIAEIFQARLDDEGRRHPRTVGLEPHHAELLPEVVISIGPDGFARLAVKAMQPRPEPQVYVDHIHAPLVSVVEQAAIVVARLREHGSATFQQLTEDTSDTLTVVARFLALLELYRDKVISLDQSEALGELLVSWTGGDVVATVTDEFDQSPHTPKDTA